MTPVMLLLLYASCIGVNATVTPVAALPGAPTGYVVSVTAPPGSEVVLYPAPGAPPVTATPVEARDGCVLYRAGPLALGSDAYVAVNASGHILAIPIIAPALKPPVEDGATTATQSVLAVKGEKGPRIDATDAQGEASSAPARTSTAAENMGKRKLLDIAVILLAVVFLLASQGARRSSSLF